MYNKPIADHPHSDVGARGEVALASVFASLRLVSTFEAHVSGVTFPPLHLESMNPRCKDPKGSLRRAMAR